MRERLFRLRRAGPIWLIGFLLAMGACSDRVGESNEASVPVERSAVGVGHIQRDASGTYFCVLRRPDDLAQLRAQFTLGFNEGQ